MVATCSVKGCKSGYASVESGPIKVSFFRFPLDPEIRDRWKHGINRPDWEPSQNSRVCSLHFKESDYQVYSKDSQIRRKRSRPSEELQRKYLLPSAVPSFSRILENDPLSEYQNIKGDD